MDDKNKQPQYVPYAEEDKIERGLVAWANKWPDIPAEVITAAGLRPPINIEPHLASKVPGMMLQTIQSAYIIGRYILGGHKAEYQFSVVYRTQSGNSSDKSLTANEVLNRFGDWATENPPTDIGEGIRVLKVEANNRAALLEKYGGGDEDHMILMTLTYEVI